jgi:hypothetical protein
VITKKAVGAAFVVLKSQNDQLAKQAADLEKAREREANADFTKRATDLGFGAEFGPTLRKAYGGDAAAQAEVEKRITGLNEQVAKGQLFANFGKISPEAGSAAAEFMAKVDAVKAANPRLTDAQAYSKAYTDRANGEIVKRMKAEAAS